MDLFPDTEVRSLSGLEATFPEDLPATRTVVVAAFLREQQEEVDRWIAALADAGVPDSPLDAGDDPPAVIVELPVLASRYRFMRRFIDGGMTRSIAVDRILARTWTAYTDAVAFRTALDIATPRVEVMVVNRLGEVLDRAHGEPSELGIARVAATALGGSAA